MSQFNATRRSPWWLLWAALLGAAMGLFAAGPPGAVSVPLAALVGFAFALFSLAILRDRQDRWVAVKLPEEVEVHEKEAA